MCLYVMSEHHTYTEVQNANSQTELIELAESDARIERVGSHSGFVWFTVNEDILLDFYTDAEPMTNLNDHRYDGMAVGIANPGHSALN